MRQSGDFLSMLSRPRLVKLSAHGEGKLVAERVPQSVFCACMIGGFHVEFQGS